MKKINTSNNAAEYHQIPNFRNISHVKKISIFIKVCPAIMLANSRIDKLTTLAK